jgi:hypothetical protein
MTLQLWERSSHFFFLFSLAQGAGIVWEAEAEHAPRRRKKNGRRKKTEKKKKLLLPLTGA